MPVRSSVCTYSPTTVPSSKHSPSSLSIGHYKPLSSNSYLGDSSSYQRNEELPSTATLRRSSNASKYRLGSYSANSYQPKPSLGSYKPLTSSSVSSSNYISRLGSSCVGSSSPRYSHYSSASSTNSSISSASFASDYSNSLSAYSSTYNHSSPTSYTSLTGSTSASLRQLSHKVSTERIAQMMRTD